MSYRCVAGQTFTFSFLLEAAGSSSLQLSPTIVAGDFARSINGGSFAALANTPTNTPSGSAWIEVVIAASETTSAGAGGIIRFQAIDAAGNEWKYVGAFVPVFATDLAAPGDAMTLADGAITAAKIASDAITAAKIADGAIDAATFAAGAINAAAIAADAITDAKVASDVTIASVTGAVGSVTGAVGSVTAGVTLADGAITAAKFAAGAINAAAIATDAIDADALAADVTTELQSGLLTTSAFNTKLGTPAGASVSVDIAAVKAETASIQADTNDLQTQIGTAGAGLTAVASQASVNTIDDFLDTEIVAIKAKTDLIPAAPAATGDIPNASAIVTAIMAYAVETGHSVETILEALYAVTRGKAVADDADTPTQIIYYAPDNTTARVTHNMTSTTRTVA